jgi:hypothetical protein
LSLYPLPDVLLSKAPVFSETKSRNSIDRPAAGVFVNPRDGNVKKVGDLVDSQECIVYNH